MESGSTQHELQSLGAKHARHLHCLSREKAARGCLPPAVPHLNVQQARVTCYAGPATQPTCQLGIPQRKCDERLPKVVIPLHTWQHSRESNDQDPNTMEHSQLNQGGGSTGAEIRRQRHRPRTHVAGHSGQRISS